MVLLRALLLALLLAAGLGSSQALAQGVLPVPVLTDRLIDQTGTLTPPQRTALVTKLEAIEREHGSQVVVLMLPSTAPEDIAAYAQRVGDAWKIGRREVGDGLLIVVAKDDRRVNLQVAKALEGAVPDLAARQIIDSAIRPAFRANDYAGGLNQALDAIKARIAAEKLPPAAAQEPGWSGPPDSGRGWSLESLGIFLFVVVPLVGMVLNAIFGRKLGSLLTAGGVGGVAGWLSASVVLGVVAGLAALLIVGVFGLGSRLRGATTRGGGFDVGPGWGGGWSGGGGGGGGFSSGGGGDFGGGGASGDW
jgi:uncharacterized protein